MIRGREHRLLVEALYSYGTDREDRLTEVLASVLEVHPRFCQLLAHSFGLQSAAKHFEVLTQVGTPGHRRLVDLALRAKDASGTTIASIFVECKYNPTRKLRAIGSLKIGPTASDGFYVKSLASGVLGGICSKADLDLVIGPAASRPEFDPRETYDEVITWSDVRALAIEAGGAVGWQIQAASASAPMPNRCLLEFLTYLEFGRRRHGCAGRR